ICDFFYPLFFPKQNVMNDLNMTNTILDTFSVKCYFPHFTFLFNCSLQNQEQPIGGFATVHLSNLNKVIVRIKQGMHFLNTVFKMYLFFFFFKTTFLIANVAVRKSRSIISRLNRKCN